MKSAEAAACKPFVRTRLNSLFRWKRFCFTCLILFNPLSKGGLARVVSNLDRSLDAKPRPVYVLYHNPLIEHVVADSRHLQRLHNGEQYSVWTNQNPATPSI
jgi:hypothetical protein